MFTKVGIKFSLGKDQPKELMLLYATAYYFPGWKRETEIFGGREKVFRERGKVFRLMEHGLKMKQKKIIKILVHENEVSVDKRRTATRMNPM